VLLFLIGGFSGVVIVFALAKIIVPFSFFKSEIILLSKGTILILGYQMYLIVSIHKMIPSSFWGEFLWAAIELVAFILFINFADQYFPLIIGKMRLNK